LHQGFLGGLLGSFKSTSVLIASLNEADGIGATMVEMQNYLRDARFLVVDGNSHDETVDIAKTLGAEIIFQQGKGKGDALRQGLAHIGSDCEFVVLTDADYTYPAEYVPKMIEIMNQYPSVGMVCGNRFNYRLNVEAMHPANHFGNRLLAYAHSLLNDVYLQDPLTGLRVCRWSMLRNWMPKSDGFDVEVELNSYFARHGYRILEVDIPYRPRLGVKKLQLKHGVSIMKRIISEAFL
jgi:glycosyltransferase involved in cell wall biosynthesis